MAERIEERLRELYHDDLRIDEPMSRHTTFRIGGAAKYMVAPETREQLAQTLHACRQEQIPYYLIGNGSNLLVSDRGYAGVIIQMYQVMDGITITGDNMVAGAGALLARAAAMACEAGLSGLAFASGIPGTLGGAVVMNAGAYGGEMKDIVSAVTVMHPSGVCETLPKEALKFGYRTSSIAEQEQIVLDVTLQLQNGDREAIAEQMKTLAAARREKQPLSYPSAGSTFKRPEGYFAGKLIQDAGLRGYQVGGARVSDKHCGFVVNTGNATAADVMRLIADVRQKIKDDFGVSLEPEVKFVGDL